MFPRPGLRCLPDIMFNPADHDTLPKQNCLCVLPPLPFVIKRSLYHCDKQFVVTDLLPMFQEHKSTSAISYGVALVSGQEFDPFKLTPSTPGSFDGQFVRAGKSHSTIQTKKQKKGGQSAQRYGRIRQEKRGVWVQKVIDSLDAAYLDKDGRPTIKGLVLAGPSTLKQELLACVAGCHSGLLPLLGSAVHLFPTSSIDTPALQTKALASVHEHMPTFFASAQHLSDEDRWSEFLAAAQQGGAAYGPQSVEDALAKCQLRLILVSASSQAANLDKWDAACVEAGALMCVVSSPTTTARLADYGGIVGVPWFSQAEQGEFDTFDDVKLEVSFGNSDVDVFESKIALPETKTDLPELSTTQLPQNTFFEMQFPDSVPFRLRASACEFVPRY